MICLLEASSSYKIYIIVYGVTQGDCIKKNSINIKTESIRKLSNFNFQWTKTLYIFQLGLEM